MAHIVKRSTSGLIFDIINYFFMVLFAITIIYPFLNLFSLSITESSSMHGLSLIPNKITFGAYRRVLNSDFILVGFYNTLIRTIGGTALSLVFTSALAYPLSKKYFPNRNFWTLLIVFTMFFGGGLIPSYLLMKSIGLINKRLALILPGLIPTYSMIIMRNYFMTIPDSLEESARIDGANDISILLKIIIPISKPILATVALWAAVGHWNSWFDCLIYITDQSKVVLQVILRRIILEGTAQMIEMNASSDDPGLGNPEVIKAAVIFVTTLPIIIVYPFVQKYFIKGIMVGSLKG